MALAKPELVEFIYQLVFKAQGKKQLKAMDLQKAVLKEHPDQNKNDVKFAIKELIDTGRRQNSWRLELAGLLASASIRGVPTEVTDLTEASALGERALALACAHGDRPSESRALWIQIHDNDLAPSFCQRRAEVGDRGGLTDSAFLVGDHNHPRHAREYR